ncbi:MAG: hypothetical protein A2076_02430 [Geobacteraceae bacterium GWC2_53_11]|nr:MAG: hypothetical protein A2076_02430 [Geobacteraceae bacterium GWC2_53_11]
MSAHNTHPLPTLKQLFKATGIALLAAAAILITTVLPSEFGIDPTGIGKAMGLTGLSATNAEAAKMPKSMETTLPVVQTPAGIVTKTELPLRSDEMSLTLQPGEGAEIKATMRKGEQFVYNWAIEGGTANVDMHGEKPNAGDKFTSYWKGQQLSGDKGTFVAPFDGTHGWFWRNRGDKPVTVTVMASGFYEKLAQMK